MSTTAAEIIDSKTLSHLVDAGAVRTATAVGQPGGWAVFIHYGMARRALAAQRSRRIRVFRRFETLVAALREMGVAKFDVDAADYNDTPKRGQARTRPDRADALKRAHAAVAHDDWFRREVQLGLEDVKAGRVIDEKEAAETWAHDRAALMKRAAKGK